MPREPQRRAKTCGFTALRDLTEKIFLSGNVISLISKLRIGISMSHEAILANGDQSYE